MSKNKKAKYSASDLTMLAARAVDHAHARRAKALSPEELELAVGGMLAGRADDGGVLTGAKGPDPEELLARKLP